MPSYVAGAMRRRISDAEIVRLYVDERLDSDSIGARAQCSGSTVLSLVRAAGFTPRLPGGRRKHSLKISEDEVVTRYLDGQSGPQIAEVAGCTPSNVYHVLRRRGVRLRDGVTAARLAERLRARPRTKQSLADGREDPALG